MSSLPIGRRLWIVAAIAILVVPCGVSASVEGEVAFHQGVAAYRAGDYATAQTHFEAVLTDTPDDASTLHYLGLIAIQNDDPEQAIPLLERAVSLDPAAAAARLDLAAQLLKLGRNGDALVQLESLLEQDPNQPKALLLQGIALYRTGRYLNARPSLERAIELDPAYSREGNYYIGLVDAFLGDLDSSIAAFSTAAGPSPQHPLGRSATTLRSQVARSQRRWSVAATAGFEYDDNVTLSPDDLSEIVPPGSDFDGRIGSPAAIMRLQAQGQAVDAERFSWRFGYDGYLRLHTESDAQILDQQTHMAWTHASYTAEKFSASLRYDFSWTALDLSESFRFINRVAPTFYVPISDWGMTMAYYQFLHYDYQIDVSNPAFDRSGPQHTVGLQQFVFLPDPINFLVLGGFVTRFDSDGSEFRHKGFEISAGGEMALFWRIEAGLLYRFDYRDYTEYSFFSPQQDPVKRLDYEHTISLNFDRPIGKHMVVTLAGSYFNNDSNIANFEIDRFIVGGYFTYDF
jgi:tetratricopeptide (TPR) repeat protein